MFEPKIVLRGKPYLNGAPVAEKDLVAMFCRKDNIKALLAELSGFFAFHIKYEKYSLAAVDRIRSLPVFYEVAEKTVDFAFYNLHKNSKPKPGTSLYNEFVTSGFVAGNRTFVPNVYQVEAGQFLIYENENLKFENYYSLWHRKDGYFDQETLETMLHGALQVTFERLLDYAGQRKIIVPLSGGFDSRLVLSMLKKLGATNVTCFSYGLKKSAEANLSSVIAESLGYDWIFVEYSNEEWRKKWSTLEAQEYQHFASNNVSLPHVQDWLAVKKLKDNNQIPEDAVFVPGHSGDFVAGSHIPSSVFNDSDLTTEKLIDKIIEDHYKNSPEIRDKNFLEFIQKEIRNALISSTCDNPESFSSNYENWDWKERQAKYIANSVKVYEFFGYNWWMPLWDKEFVEFWENVPLPLRRGRLWYNYNVSKLYAELTDSKYHSFGQQNAGDISVGREFLKRGYHKLPLCIKDYLYKRKLYKELKTHHLALGGLIDLNQLHKRIRRGNNIIGIYSESFLSDSWGAD